MWFAATTHRTSPRRLNSAQHRAPRGGHVSEADVGSRSGARGRRRLGAGLAALAMLTGVAACTQSADSSKPLAVGAAPSAASSSADPAAATAGKAAVEAYN